MHECADVATAATATTQSLAHTDTSCIHTNTLILGICTSHVQIHTRCGKAVIIFVLLLLLLLTRQTSAHFRCNQTRNIVRTTMRRLAWRCLDEFRNIFTRNAALRCIYTIYVHNVCRSSECAVRCTTCAHVD